MRWFWPPSVGPSGGSNGGSLRKPWKASTLAWKMLGFRFHLLGMGLQFRIQDRLGLEGFGVVEVNYKRLRCGPYSSEAQDVGLSEHPRMVCRAVMQLRLRRESLDCSIAGMCASGFAVVSCCLGHMTLSKRCWDISCLSLGKYISYPASSFVWAQRVASLSV